jgi:hypothetical protein
MYRFANQRFASVSNTNSISVSPLAAAAQETTESSISFDAIVSLL